MFTKATFSSSNIVKYADLVLKRPFLLLSMLKLKKRKRKEN